MKSCFWKVYKAESKWALSSFYWIVYNEEGKWAVVFEKFVKQKVHEKLFLKSL